MVSSLSTRSYTWSGDGDDDGDGCGGEGSDGYIDHEDDTHLAAITLIQLHHLPLLPDNVHSVLTDWRLRKEKW